MNTIDYEDLDPGVRNVVLSLRADGFETVDSGDGEHKVSLIASGDALPYPHVMIRVEPARLIQESHRLHAVRVALGPLFAEGRVEASYDPEDMIGILTLVGRGG